MRNWYIFIQANAFENFVWKMAAILSRPQCVYTLRPRQNGRHFPDDIFEWIFWNENVWISINISLKFVPRGPVNNIPTLLQVMAWRRPGDKPLSEPMMVRLTTHICVTRPQWVKKWLCYSGHRVALVAHRAQKSVPDSAGEWPTFLPPPLESCSGTANVDGPNWGSPGVMKLWVAWEVLRWLMKFRELCSGGFHPKLVTPPYHGFLNVNTPPNSQNSKRH